MAAGQEITAALALHTANTVRASVVRRNEGVCFLMDSPEGLKKVCQGFHKVYKKYFHATVLQDIGMKAFAKLYSGDINLTSNKHTGQSRALYQRIISIIFLLKGNADKSFN
jgi:hypothetical protein